MTDEPVKLSYGAESVLLAFFDESIGAGHPLTGNEVAMRCGFQPNMARQGNHGTGNTTRVMGPAVHVVVALTSLRKKGLIAHRYRRDGLTGTADAITRDGVARAHLIDRAKIIDYRKATIKAKSQRWS